MNGCRKMMRATTVMAAMRMNEKDGDDAVDSTICTRAVLLFVEMLVSRRGILVVTGIVFRI
eukprot:281874-Rhodomonas_salina.3